MKRDLTRLLRPRSLALIGGNWAANAVRATDAMGYSGEVWPVHPTKTEVAGHKAYPALSSLPHAPDAAFVAVNRDASPAIMAELAAMGAGGAVSFASGFAETGDGDRQAALIAAAGDMPMLGPNCYGVINYLDGALLWPDQHGGQRVESGVAIISQSSNIAINMTMAARGLPIAYVVCVGNQAQTGLADIGRALGADPRVTALGFYIEGIGDPADFHDMVQTIRQPVVAFKAGRSEAAQAATISHTASLAGSDAASGAFFARAGVPLLTSLPTFLESLKLLHIHGPLPGRSICSISCSGGEASIAADAAEGRDVTFPAFTAADKTRIRATLSDLVEIANPLDYHTFIWGDQPRMTACFAAVMTTGFDLTLFIIDFPRTDRCRTDDWAPAVAAIKAAAAQTGQRAAVVTTLAENLPEAVADDFAAAGIAPLYGIDDAISAIEAAATCAGASHAVRAALYQPAPPADAPPASLITEDAAKTELASYGLAAPVGKTVPTPAAAALAAADIGGPVAIKRIGIAHKTEASAVALNQSADTIADTAHVLGTGPYLVEAMVQDPVAELILGAHRDPAYGLVMTIGSGGVIAELLEDSTTCLLPVTEAEARTAILSLKLAPLLTGYRGRPKADLAAAIRAITALSNYLVENHQKVEELDINPLIVTTTGAVMADALIRKRT